MRILLVHNHYGSAAPSGENEVVRIETELLRVHGHEVRAFERHSDEIRARGLAGAVQGALAVPWNPFEARRLAAAARGFAPDVVHVHNSFPLISPAVLHAAPATAARVQTLHNYRLLCAAAIPVRAGRPCTDCIDRRSAWPALRHGCYRGSRLATLPLAAGIALHRRVGTWQHEVDAFVALTPFQRELMVRGGLPAERVHVKPNFFPGDPAVRPWPQRDAHCIFVGRLSAEKGVATLLRAWRDWGASAPTLLIVGDGVLRGELEAAARGLPVRFTGQLAPAQAQALIGQSRLLILPSEWFEGFPMVLREAFALGTPAAVSRLGPLPSLVGEGRCGPVFAPFDAAALRAAVQAAWSDPEGLQAMGRAAREAFEASYTAAANYRQLRAIYDAAMAHRRALVPAR